MLTIGGTFASTGDAEARTCVRLGNGIEICIDDSLPPGGGGGVIVPPPGGGGQYDQTTGITTANGTRESITQTFTPGAAPAGKTRICLTNMTRGQRDLFHDHQPQINPFRLAANGRDCANFPANSRVTFIPVAADQMAKPDNMLTYSTTALAGGLLDLVWRQ
jgi:hypothetical protein